MAKRHCLPDVQDWTTQQMWWWHSWIQLQTWGLSNWQTSRTIGRHTSHSTFPFSEVCFHETTSSRYSGCCTWEKHLVQQNAAKFSLSLTSFYPYSEACFHETTSSRFLDITCERHLVQQNEAKYSLSLISFYPYFRHISRHPGSSQLMSPWLPFGGVWFSANTSKESHNPGG